MVNCPFDSRKRKQEAFAAQKVQHRFRGSGTAVQRCQSLMSERGRGELVLAVGGTLITSVLLLTAVEGT